jgi:SAM-dependent methyltransferase
MSVSQEGIFRRGEGDAWFRRNRDNLLSKTEPDWIEHLLSGLAGIDEVASVCDLGCANGWRLQRLKHLFAPGCALTGVDASGAAIRDGRGRFPELRLHEGVLSQIPLTGSFDLVIVSFVLHWIDRSQLSRVIAEIDRLVAWNGYLLVSDFLPDSPRCRSYHHLPDQGVFTYKQDYSRAFVGLELYREVRRHAFPHASPGPSGNGAHATQSIDSDDRCACVLLRKVNLYVES